jgi:hypothetical protein
MGFNFVILRSEGEPVFSGPVHACFWREWAERARQDRRTFCLPLKVHAIYTTALMTTPQKALLDLLYQPPSISENPFDQCYQWLGFDFCLCAEIPLSFFRHDSRHPHARTKSFTAA